MHRMPGHTDCSLEEQVSSIDKEGLFHGLAHPLGELAYIHVRFDARHQDGKFISAKATNDASLAAAFLGKCATKSIADRTQQFGSGVISHRFVDETETFDIEKYDNGIALCFLRVCDQVFQFLDQ